MRILIVLCSLIVPICIIAQEAKHLVFIGIDGFSSAALEKAELPTIRRLMDNGSYSLKKRSVLPSSSAPNWASIFMGVPTEIHGYTQWDSKEPDIALPMEFKNNIFPTIFQVVKGQRTHNKVACIYEWTGMKYLIDTLSLDFHQEIIDFLENKTLLTDIACKYIQNEKPILLGVIYASPDEIGHKFGFESNEYYSELKKVDYGIKQIINSVIKADILDETTFIITSDHGGLGNSHGGISLQEMETPLIITGTGVKKNNQIEGLFIQYDIPLLIAEILNIKIPDVWRGRSFYDQIKDEFSHLSIDFIEQERGDLVRIFFYDLQGRRYNQEPMTGITIRQEVYKNGIIHQKKYSISNL